jgi:XTP/dITP diphosphohydrolase
MKVILASSNKEKIKEIKKFLKNFEIVSFSELIKPFKIEENGNSFKENAIIKAKTIHQKFPKNIILADDSGISVDILGGKPGIYSARYAGDNASDKENLYKLINELKKRNIKKTSAYYTTAIAIATPYGIYTTHGFMKGEIIDEARGTNGFGYDPIFIPKGFNKTLGELEEDVKIIISHRSKALKLAKIILDIFKNSLN